MKNVVRKQDLEVKFACVTGAWLAQMGQHSSTEQLDQHSWSLITETKVLPLYWSLQMGLVFLDKAKKP